MTTLALLKARIWDDLFKQDDLDPSKPDSPQIGQAIDDAIRHYQRKRFYFNERRDLTFATLPGQVWYGVGDDADIPAFVRLDGLFLQRPGGQLTELRQVENNEFEYLTDGTSSKGEPLFYTYFGRQLGVYPIPGDTYTVRMMGHVLVPGPAADDEEDNVWMTEAFELIRCKAKKQLFGHVKQDPQMASVYDTMEREALAALRSETTRRVMYDGFEKTQF